MGVNIVQQGALPNPHNFDSGGYDCFLVSVCFFVGVQNAGIHAFLLLLCVSSTGFSGVLGVGVSRNTLSEPLNTIRNLLKKHLDYQKSNEP